MKIKFSLRLYFFSAMTLLAVGLGVLFFLVSRSYFIDGLDAVIRVSMIEVADELDALEGQSNELMGFIVTSRWQDMPERIKHNIQTPPREPGQFVKHVVVESIFERPKHAYFVIYITDKNGRHEYVARSLDPQIPKRFQDSPEEQVFGLLLLCIGIVIAFIVVMILMIRSVYVPVDTLTQWTRKLKRENLNDELPALRYPELQAFAEAIRSSLVTAQNSLDREHNFLRHASHELRTPIAVTGSSVELLKRLVDDEANPKQIEVIDRIDRASRTMKSLTETLLWLSRENEAPLPLVPIRLDELIIQLKRDLFYLLQGKPKVEVLCETDEIELLLPSEVSQIILGNLIRNAFQHTHEGKIVIKQTSTLVTIANPSSESPQGEQQELGFGLGLYLCKRLSERVGWPLNLNSNENNFVVTIQFNDGH